VAHPRRASAALGAAAAAAALAAGAGGAVALAARTASAHARHGLGCAQRSSFQQGSHNGRHAHHRCSTPHGGRHHPAHAGTCQWTQARPSARNIAIVRSAVFCLINRERIRRGELPLRPNMRLRRAAQRYTESMAFGGYFTHVGPGGGTPVSRMRAVGYISGRVRGYEVGENIGWGTLRLATPAAIVAAWMASPGHRANILDPRFRDTAIGVWPHVPRSFGHGQPGALYTQDFGVVVG
jgi:uncharacterized protein YkwD